MGDTDVSEMIEVLAFEASCTVGTESGGGNLATGMRRYKPAVFEVRMGKATPLIAKAMRMNQRIDLTLHLFRNDQDTGATSKLYEYGIQTGRIVEFTVISPDTMDPETASRPPYCRFGVVPRIVTNTSDAGTMDEDDWSNQGGG